MSLEQVAVLNVNIEKQLTRSRTSLEVPASHLDVSSLFNQSEEFVNPSEIVKGMKEREKEERFKRQQKRRRSSMFNVGGGGKKRDRSKTIRAGGNR